MKNTPSLLKKRLLQIAWPLFFFLKKIGRTIYFIGLEYEFFKDWGSYPNPEWFDHEFDLAFFPKWRKAHFFERGIYLQEILKGQHKVLDLCCGDGSVTSLFIAPKVAQVIGVDFDQNAIDHAIKKYSGIKNLSYQKMDIRNLNFPKETFDIVTWDAAIEHFTQKEMDLIFQSIQTVLKPDGLLIGSTIAKQEHLQHHDHEYEFDSVSELQIFLKNYYQNVFTWERSHDDRRNFYFRCSKNNFNLTTRSSN